MTRKCKTMAEFLLPALDSQKYEHRLKWEIFSSDLRMFSVAFKHKNSANWVAKDASVFIDWDKAKNRSQSETSKPDYPTTSRQRFRSALNNKSNGITQLRKQEVMDFGVDPKVGVLYFLFDQSALNQSERKKKTLKRMKKSQINILEVPNPEMMEMGMNCWTEEFNALEYIPVLDGFLNSGAGNSSNFPHDSDPQYGHQVVPNKDNVQDYNDVEKLSSELYLSNDAKIADSDMASVEMYSEIGDFSNINDEFLSFFNDDP